MSILALPQTTVRAIGSSQVLTDPCSVVKELVDNALDARAKAIFVEISSNTLDVIQVKDNGHGIAPEDREMVCRRYCTSKLREYSDLRDVGGRWLGFRGEALASAAEMAGSMMVVTRVQGEDVAATLKVGRMGEVQSQERISHPVGTTIRVSDFFKNLPVRKQTALKSSAKTLAKIKQTLQAYALARPAIRFSLRVLKAKNEKCNWTYAPNVATGMADAALKVLGKDTAGECFYTVHTSNECDYRDTVEHDEEGANEDQRQEGGFRIEAFLPKADADPSKISGQGHYISIDSRPVSCTRGVLKQILALYKNYIRSALLPSSASRLVNPFICMNIACPPGSYDANVEPAKDDVLFEDSKHVLSVVESFLKSIYGELVTIGEDVAKVPKSRGAMANKSFDLLLAKKPPSTDAVEKSTASIVSPILSESGLGLNADLTSPLLQQTPEKAPHISSGILVPLVSEPHPSEDDSIDNERSAKRQRTWRFNMCGGDEEVMNGSTKSNDQDQRPPSEDEPEALRDVGINSPWIIAQMNAAVRPKQLDITKMIGEDDEARNNQLLTPARDPIPSERLSTPFPRLKPSGDVRRQALPTPERSHLSSSPLKGLLSSPLQHIFDPAARLRDSSETLDHEVNTPPHTRLQDPSHSLDSLNDDSPLDESRCEPLRAPVNDFISARDLPLGTPLQEIPTVPARPPRRREPRKKAQHQSTINKPFVSPVHDPDQVWFQTDAPPRRSKPSAKPRAGTVRGAINLSAPVRSDSEDEELLESDTARARASTRDADIKAALQYEHRKQAATKRRRSQLLLSSSGTLENPPHVEDNVERLPQSTKSPHRNRYNAARAALGRPTPQPFANTINITANNHAVSDGPSKSTALPDGDPRAYLMRVRRRSANHQAASKENGTNGLKIKRTKTMMLPLESTPVECRTQNLSLVLGLGMESVEREARKARDFEQYVSGEFASGAFEGVGEEEIRVLEEGLRGLLKEVGWRMDGEEGDVGVDLRTAFEAYGTAVSMET